MHMVAGEPYTWPTGAARRVENFVDLAHFAWVHEATLGNRDHPVPPDVEVSRVAGELRFEFVPPPVPGQTATALTGPSRYRMPMPLTVDIEFSIAGTPGARRHLWMTASPVDPGVCRTFWSVSRNDLLDRPDEEFLEFQRVVLAEDEPVVCNQEPAELPLEVTFELNVKADKVSVEYRRWLRDLAGAAIRGPAALAAAMGAARPLEASCAT
jgi:phenylpropionate dioxygenase-like ring-hydroxylating dioxygenase large terminal subunit